jgi:hypothetical protein
LGKGNTRIVWRTKMETTDPTVIGLISFLREFGLPTFICMYLLISFKKQLEELTKTISRLTGVVITLSTFNKKTDGGDNDL